MANYPTAARLNDKPLQASIDDVSTADQAYVAPGFRGRIKRVYATIDGAITVADAVLTIKINGTSIGQTLTITQSGSAAGSVFELVVDPLETLANFDENDNIEIETDGGSTTARKLSITLILEAK